MDLQTLTAKTRDKLGKGAVGRMRRDGEVPAVLYGHGKKPVSLSIEYSAFRQLVHGKQGEHAIVDLQVQDDPDSSGPAIVKEVQHHPVRGSYEHADLMRIDLKEKIRTMVPVKLEGHSVGIIEGGVLDHQSREIEVECLALEVPESITANITELDIGQSLHVDQLVFPEGITVITPGDRNVVAVHAPRVIVEVEEEGVEAVEGEEGEPTEGAEGAEEGAAESEEKSGD